LSAAIIPGQTQPSGTSSGTERRRARDATRPRRRFFGLLSSFGSLDEAENHALETVPSDQLQIAVLISLPVPPPMQRETDIGMVKGKEKDVRSDDMNDTGEVLFGVTEVPWTGGSDWGLMQRRKRRRNDDCAILFL
jgi:hypothetical protein